MTNSLIIFAVLYFSSVSVWAQNPSTLTLNNGSSCDGLDSFISPNAVPNLAEVGWEGRAGSTYESGTWVYYDYIDYGVEDFNCTKVRWSIAGCISGFNCWGFTHKSLRVVGDANDYTKDTITFYEKDVYRTGQQYVEEDTPQLSISIASIIMTGPSAWTVYDEPNYGGQTACITTNTVTVHFTTVSDTSRMNPPFLHGTISSVRKGCHSSNIHVPKSPLQKENAWVVEQCRKQSNL